MYCAIPDSVSRYFYHATNARMSDAEYMVDSEMDDEISTSPEPEVAAAISPQRMEIDNELKVEDIDPSLSDWFQVDRDQAAETLNQKYNDDDSETEPDSENEDVKSNEVDIDEPDDDWLEVSPQVVSLCSL